MPGDDRRGPQPGRLFAEDGRPAKQCEGDAGDAEHEQRQRGDARYPEQRRWRWDLQPGRHSTRSAASSIRPSPVDPACAP